MFGRWQLGILGRSKVIWTFGCSRSNVWTLECMFGRLNVWTFECLDVCMLNGLEAFCLDGSWGAWCRALDFLGQSIVLHWRAPEMGFCFMFRRLVFKFSVWTFECLGTIYLSSLYD